jgi:transcriptional regulator with XRE-family HTH domain
MNQADLARKLGITPSAVSQFERLGSDPRLSTLRRYAVALDVMVTHEIHTDAVRHIADVQALSEPKVPDPVPESWTVEYRNDAETVRINVDREVHHVG